MSEPFLLSRVLLKFDAEVDERIHDLSAVTTSPDGYLWLGSDEGRCIERLSQGLPQRFSQHRFFSLDHLVEVFDQNDEADIEGMDYAAPYLWFTGSHSHKRKRAKKKDPIKNIERLSEIKTEPNRFMLGRIPVVQGELVKTCVGLPEHNSYRPAEPDAVLSASLLQKTDDTNVLIQALQADEHLGKIITSHLPSKDNGLDIEGLAVRDKTVFLGLRGPVLRGWAIILELEIEETADPEVLNLAVLNEAGDRYRKHFVDLGGLGVRDLCFDGDDLLILAGPTMTLDGSQGVFRLRDALSHSQDTLWSQDSDGLETVFHLTLHPGGDRAEGMALLPCFEEERSLLIVYDAPHANRYIDDLAIYMDVFRLPH